MSYNEMPHILINSVVLPNKPLSNIKKLMLLKCYYGMGLEVFLRDTLPKNTKLNECGILNFDSSSGDGYVIQKR